MKRLLVYAGAIAFDVLIWIVLVLIFTVLVDLLTS